MEGSLQKEGHVMADFNLRQKAIVEQVNKLAAARGVRALIDPDLLDEVTALVEWPNAMPGQFDKEYLQVPQEALYWLLRAMKPKLVPCLGMLLHCGLRASH